jgi:hypothetical protein
MNYHPLLAPTRAKNILKFDRVGKKIETGNLDPATNFILQFLGLDPLIWLLFRMRILG